MWITASSDIRLYSSIPVDQRTPIKVIFFSPGGELEVNNCLVDTIQLSTTKVIGINVGVAASSGCFIYLSCHERYTFPTAEFLVHKGGGSFAGNYNEVVAAIMNYQRQIEELGNFVLSRTKIPEDVFYENFDNDWYLSASMLCNTYIFNQTWCWSVSNRMQ